MRMRPVLAVAATAAALFAPPARATDAPHDESFTEGLCQSCHKLHASSGGTLTNQPDNNTTCTACHDSMAPGTSQRGFPWGTARQAIPGTGGVHHSWTGDAWNATIGAQPPTHAEMLARLNAGMLQCSTCHDQHKSNRQNAPGSQLTSIPIGVAKGENGNELGPRGNATLTLASVSSAVGAKGTRIRIRTVTPGTGGTFIVSHDFGAASPTWFNWDGAWIPGSSGGPGKPYSEGQTVAIDDPGVSVAISGGASVGDYWDFSISYPFLRASNVDDAMCQDCHRDRVMNHACVEGQGGCAADGVRTFSHPVNQALNANAKNYDRTPANADPAARQLLDADGRPQATGDGIATNDLRLTASGRVGCTTCHAPHNADSNSLTDDPR